MSARGPYGTNEGDIWTMDGSVVGDMLRDQDNLIGIHEVLRDPKTGKLDERIYCVDLASEDPEIQTLIARARAGDAKRLAAEAAQN